MRAPVLVVAVLCSGQVAAAPADELAALDALFVRRAEPEALEELTRRLDAALESAPQDYELLWRAARARHWEADGTDDRERRRQLAREAWALGEHAVAQAPERAEGHYFAALGMGAYAQAVGVLKALREGLETKFNARLGRALALDPGMQAGGPLVARGRYYYELPWPKRRLGKSAEVLRQVTAEHPENLRARLYLAETLLKDGKAREAQAELQKVLEGSVAYDPPEGARVKGWARAVQARIQEELR